MSSPGSDDALLERNEAANAGLAAPHSSLATTTSVSAAPLWMAFRDYYTRAKGRSHLIEPGDWIAADQDFACPLPLFPWDQP